MIYFELLVSGGHWSPQIKCVGWKTTPRRKGRGTKCDETDFKSYNRNTWHSNKRFKNNKLKFNSTNNMNNNGSKDKDFNNINNRGTFFHHHYHPCHSKPCKDQFQSLQKATQDSYRTSNWRSLLAKHLLRNGGWSSWHSSAFKICRNKHPFCTCRSF